MTLGFLVSFGGILAVVLVSLIVEQILIRRSQPSGPDTNAELSDVSAALSRAAGAARQIEHELARAREALRTR